jgi:hypothetical protein
MSCRNCLWCVRNLSHPSFANREYLPIFATQLLNILISWRILELCLIKGGDSVAFTEFLESYRPRQSKGWGGRRRCTCRNGSKHRSRSRRGSGRCKMKGRSENMRDLWVVILMRLLLLLKNDLSKARICDSELKQKIVWKRSSRGRDNGRNRSSRCGNRSSRCGNRSNRNGDDAGPNSLRFGKMGRYRRTVDHSSILDLATMLIR